MKKYFALVAAFVLCFAMSALAIHAEIPSESQAVVAKGSTQITIGGDLRFRGSLWHNTVDFNSDAVNNGGDRMMYESRVRLLVDAQVSPSTMGRIHLEAGTSTVNDNMIWGENGAGALGTVRQGDAKANQMQVLEAWLQHKSAGLLGVPAYVKVGHMPIRIGNGLFVDHVRFGDDALLLGIEPVKGLEFTFGNVKLRENLNSNADDSDAYTLIAAYQINKDTKVGADLTFVNGQNGGSGFAGDVHLWNLGLNAQTRIVGLGLKGEVDIQRGSEKEMVGIENLKLRGWAATFDADYKINPVTIKAGAGYGSGDNDGDNKVEYFITSQSSIPHYTFVYDYLTVNGMGNNGGGLQNTWYLRTGIAADITKDLYADTTIYYLRAVKKLNVNTGFTGVGGFTTAGDSKNIGVEIDANIKYKIDRNLLYYVEGGYLFAGNFFKQFGTNRTPDDAYVVRHGIQLSF